MKAEVITREEMIRRYCERQDSTPEQAEQRMLEAEAVRDVAGWFLLEGAMLGSRTLGERTMVAYGPGCTFKEPPPHPVSPRGLASDMAVVVAVTQ